MTSQLSRWVCALLLVGLCAAEAPAYSTTCACLRLLRAGDPASVEMEQFCERRLGLRELRFWHRGIPRPTHTVIMAGSLSDTLGFQRGVDFDGTDVGKATMTSAFDMGLTIFDTRGRQQMLLAFFTRERDGRSWQVHLGVDAGDQGGRAGDLLLIGNGGRLRVDDAGVLRVTTRPQGMFTFKDAKPQWIRLDLDLMTEGPGPSGVSCVSEDGVPVDEPAPAVGG